MTTWFISDLHLSPQRPDISALFGQFCAELKATDRLYILGDLVDAWIGDDDDRPFASNLKDTLAATTARGIEVFFMVGNRDFLISEAFAKATGITLLADPQVIEVERQKVVLLHGDSLCTDDVSYQRFRRIIRTPWLLKLLLALPLTIRQGIANKLRASSKTQQPLSAEQLAIMDVNEKAVQRCFADQDVHLMIHGHTHRPDIHQHCVADTHCTRIVLGDWYEQGSMLRWDTDGYELIQQPLPQLN